MKIIAEEALDALARGDAIVSGAVAITADDPVRVWGGYGVIGIGGDPFVGLGDRGLAQVTGGAIGGTEQNVTLSLSSVEPETAALLDATEIMGAGTVVHRLIFDGSGTQLLDQRPFKRGRVDDVVVEEEIGGDADITVQVESAARGLGRANVRMRSDADQRRVDPDDPFFEHVAFAAEIQLYFGGKKSSAAGG